MTLENVVALAVRIFAIVLAIYAFRNGISLVPFFHEQGWQDSSYIYAAFMISLFVLAIGLWNFPLIVARGLVSFSDREEIEIDSATVEKIQAAAFAVLGMYLLFYVVSDIAYWGSILLIDQRNPELLIEITPDQKGAMVATLIEFIFALFLLLGSNRIVGLLHRLRYGNNI